PQVPRIGGFGPTNSGLEVSVMLKPVKTSTPKRSENSRYWSLSGTIVTFFSGWVRSSGDGGSFNRKGVIAPSRIVWVTPNRRIVDQNASVRNDSTSAKEPPRISVAQIGPAPPMWNIGSVTSVRSSGSIELFGMK